MSQPQQQEEKTKDEKTKTHINLKVVNAEGNEVFFKIKRKTSMKKLMDAYCERQGLVLGSVRFTFDGNRLSPDKSPNDYEMEDQDVIDAMREQTGGRTYHFI